MKFLLFGTGEYYRRYKKWFAKEDVLALLDNSLQKQKSVIDEIQVLSPEEGIKLPYDIVVILSFYYREMKEQLCNLGVQEDKIVHFYDLHQLLYDKRIRKPIYYFNNAESVLKDNMEKKRTLQKKILLMSLDLELGGPALALFYAAKILVRQGYSLVFASMMDGPLRLALDKENISVVIDTNLQISTMEETEWLVGFDMILCNTLNFHVFLSRRDKSVPVIWWLHDSAFFYHGVNRKVMQDISRENLEVCSVGPVPEQAIHEFLPDLPVSYLIYGVEDIVGSVREKNGLCKQHKKLCFVTIGYIENRKGQDILLRAIRLVPKDLIEQAEFYFVGDNSSVMAQNLIEDIEKTPEIIITGKVDRKRINEFLNYADMLICPSREDPMPTVAAEAMMHGVPCLVSDAAGTAAYIKDSTDGLIFQSENVQMLSEKISWCIQNGDVLRKMREPARKIYDEFFSMEVFEKRLMELVNKYI